jgi:hypothetical protein
MWVPSGEYKVSVLRGGELTMFGYIRPLKGELKVSEFEKFKACTAPYVMLGREYGPFARFLLIMTLCFGDAALGVNERPQYEFHKVHCKPHHKKVRLHRDESAGTERRLQHDPHMVEN